MMNDRLYDRRLVSRWAELGVGQEYEVQEAGTVHGYLSHRERDPMCRVSAR